MGTRPDEPPSGIAFLHGAANPGKKPLLADLVPDLPTRTSLLAADLPSTSWFGHVLLQQKGKFFATGTPGVV